MKGPLSPQPGRLASLEGKRQRKTTHRKRKSQSGRIWSKGDPCLAHPCRTKSKKGGLPKEGVQSAALSEAGDGKKTKRRASLRPQMCQHRGTPKIVVSPLVAIQSHFKIGEPSKWGFAILAALTNDQANVLSGSRQFPRNLWMFVRGNRARRSYWLFSSIS